MNLSYGPSEDGGPPSDVFSTEAEAVAWLQRRGNDQLAELLARQAAPDDEVDIARSQVESFRDLVPLESSERTSTWTAPADPPVGRVVLELVDAGWRVQQMAWEVPMSVCEAAARSTGGAVHGVESG